MANPPRGCRARQVRSAAPSARDVPEQGGGGGRRAVERRRRRAEAAPPVEVAAEGWSLAAQAQAQRCERRRRGQPRRELVFLRVVVRLRGAPRARATRVAVASVQNPNMILLPHQTAASTQDAAPPTQTAVAAYRVAAAEAETLERWIRCGGQPERGVGDHRAALYQPPTPV